MTMDRVGERLRLSLAEGAGPCAIMPIAGCYRCGAEWEGHGAERRAREHSVATGHDTWHLSGQWDIFCQHREAA